MTSSPCWRTAVRAAPLVPLGIVVVTVGALVVAVPGDPGALGRLLVVPALVTAAVAASAIDDPAEPVIAATPTGRPARWTARALVGVVVGAVAWLVVVVAGAVAVAVRRDLPVGTVLDELATTSLAARQGALFAVALFVAGVAVARSGPGTAVRTAGPALVLFHVAFVVTGHRWPAPPGADVGSAAWWVAVGLLATVGALVAASDPSRHRLVGR